MLLKPSFILTRCQSRFINDNNFFVTQICTLSSLSKLNKIYVTKFLLNKLRIFHTIIRYIYCFIISNRIKFLLNPFNALFNPVVSPFHPCPSPFMPLPAPPAIRPRPIQPYLGIYPRFKYTMEKHKTFVTHLRHLKRFQH